MKNFIIFIIIFEVVVCQRSVFYRSPDDIVFPGQSGKSYVRNQNSQSALSRSLALAKQIDEADSIDEFLNFLDDVPPEERDSGFELRMGGTERSNAIKPKAAKCEPELQPVSFMEAAYDPSAVYYPLCTRIKRCGGCCNHPSMVCEPTEIENRNFEVIVTRVTDTGGRQWVNKTIIPLEEHTKCKCVCRQKAEHCTAKQIYNEELCSCMCANSDEQEKCVTFSESKLWDIKTCSCRCRNIRQCSSGYYFDQNTCSCQDISTGWTNDRRGGNNFRKTSETEDIPSELIPPSSTDPRRKHKDEPH